MAEFGGPIHLDKEAVNRHVPEAVPGVFALGFARPQEEAVFIAFVGRSDGDLQRALQRHVGGPYTACFWLPTASSAAAYAEECAIWHEMGGEELDSLMHPVPPGDFACPICA